MWCYFVNSVGYIPYICVHQVIISYCWLAVLLFVVVCYLLLVWGCAWLACLCWFDFDVWVACLLVACGFLFLGSCGFSCLVNVLVIRLTIHLLCGVACGCLHVVVFGLVCGRFGGCLVGVGRLLEVWLVCFGRCVFAFSLA